ncbi:outer membrane protein OmpK [Shewanella sedimentimangrovi]|uniref:Ion channel protein Tsx n=1 Tax=Shewanella sedimentimangrovi TaxID=2814293 RepID=A0ABX7R1G9_9GAMM|nr:outer membrane protein OmpK [Shewanella sedimentimangrovi]QSX37647.1 ion channel protein Tsx [Shewanella sedimentimangrovi]
MKKTCLCLALLLSPQAFAGEWVQWWNAGITGLYGKNYDLAPSDEQTTITLDSAGGWKYGDWYVFQDFIRFNGADEGTTYGELSTRLSAGKLLNQKLALGPVTDVSVALTLEEGEGPVESFLYGIGLDFNLPIFSYFQLNTYRRHAINGANNSDGWQITPVYRVDIPFAGSNLVIDGFADWVFRTDGNGYHENLHFNPQVKFDLGQMVFGDHRKDALLVGIEYDYWRNKYGVDGIDQNTYSLIAQYHF